MNKDRLPNSQHLKIAIFNKNNSKKTAFEHKRMLFSYCYYAGIIA